MRKQRCLRSNKMMVILVSIALFVLFLFTGAAKVRAFEMQSERVTYRSVRIEMGDSLWSICEQYGKEDPQGTEAFMKKVTSLNQICQDATIHAGNYLIIPVISD